MLTGQAKVDYQREYMRRRRAGLGKPVKAERDGPTDRDLHEAKYLVSRMARHFYTPFGRRMTWGSGIEPTDLDAVERVARRIREHKIGLKLEKKERVKEKEAQGARAELRFAELTASQNDWEYSRWPKPVFTCVFCDATSDKAKMSGNECTAICIDCARESVRILESNAPV